MDVTPDNPDETETLPDYRESPYLRFGATPPMDGDPETELLFTQALAFLEAITDHFVEFVPWTKKTTRDLVEELNHHNGWAQADGTLPEGEEVTLTQLQALSRRRMLAFEETGWNLTHYDRLVRFIDQLIEQAVMAEAELAQWSYIPADNTLLGYLRLLATLPPEAQVDMDDPDASRYEGVGGCLTCASGQPCQTRMMEDIDAILSTADLPISYALACLQWMINEGCSSLTQSIDAMAEAFTAAHSQHTAPPSAAAAATGADLPELAHTEADRLSRRSPKFD